MEQDELSQSIQGPAPKLFSQVQSIKSALNLSNTDWLRLRLTSGPVDVSANRSAQLLHVGLDGLDRTLLRMSAQQVTQRTEVLLGDVDRDLRH